MAGKPEQIQTFTAGDWTELSLRQLTTLLDRRYERYGVLFSFRTLDTGAVALWSSKHLAQDMQRDAAQYTQGFVDGWAIANGA